MVILRVHSNLKQILDERNLSIRKVSHDIDYRFGTVRQMYNDETKHYPEELLSKLCEYLNVEIKDLLVLREDNETAE